MPQTVNRPKKAVSEEVYGLDREKHRIVSELRSYNILRELGSGGEGCCLELEAEGKKYVAKVVNHRLSYLGILGKDKAGRGLKKEYIVLKELKHPGIANYVEVIDDPANRMCIMIREKAEGRTLDELLKEKTKFDEKTAFRYLTKICDILEYTHDANQHLKLGAVIHRDLKPKNVVVDENEDVKLIDFGVARIENGSHTTVTFGGGSFDYAAPEQYCSNDDCGPWTDIYALGITSLELLLGNVPEDLKNHKINGKYQIPESVSPEIKKVLSKMIERDIAKRYKSISELRRDLTSLNGLERVVEKELTRELIAIENELTYVRNQIEDKEKMFKGFYNTNNLIALGGIIAELAMGIGSANPNIPYCFALGLAIILPLLNKGVLIKNYKGAIKPLKDKERELTEQLPIDESLTLRDYFTRSYVKNSYVRSKNVGDEIDESLFLENVIRFGLEVIPFKDRILKRAHSISEQKLVDILKDMKIAESRREANRVIQLLLDNNGIEVTRKDYIHAERIDNEEIAFQLFHNGAQSTRRDLNKTNLNLNNKESRVIILNEEDGPKLIFVDPNNNVIP